MGLSTYQWHSHLNYFCYELCKWKLHSWKLTGGHQSHGGLMAQVLLSDNFDCIHKLVLDSQREGKKKLLQHSQLHHQDELRHICIS